MKASTLLLFTLLLTACGVARPVLESDNTKVEVKVVEKLVRDTAWFEMPVFVEKLVTLDTASVLENKYAKSAASVSGGVLTHSLSTKPVREPVSVEYKEVVRDSIVYRDRVNTVTVEVEKKLSWWQALKLRIGGYALLLITVALLYIVLSKFFNLNLLRL